MRERSHYRCDTNQGGKCWGVSDADSDVPDGGRTPSSYGKGIWSLADPAGCGVRSGAGPGGNGPEACASWHSEDAEAGNDVDAIVESTEASEALLLRDRSGQKNPERLQDNRPR